MREKQPCQAPEHSEFCPCQTCKKRECKRCPLITRDHFTGRAIAKELGWDRKEVQADDNVLWLASCCHQEKDKGTQKVIKQLQQQKNGRFIGLGEHQNAGLEG